MTNPTNTTYEFPSPEWCVAYRDAINANTAYKNAAKDWNHGSVAMVVKADPALRIEEDTAMLLDTHQGTCRSCTLMPAKDVEAAGASFVIVAPYALWKIVIRGELDPTKGMMQNKLKLTKGHMPTMVKYVLASKELVKSTERVPTKFRDE
jgi:putative sterol carrier protein